MSLYTNEEEKVIKAFRAKLKDLKLDADKNASAYLIRWLRARDMNIPKAEESFRNFIKWRKDENIDNILKWNPPKELTRFVEFNQRGVDNEGSPVYVVTVNINKMDECMAFDMKTLLKFVCYKFEGFEKAAKFAPGDKKPSRQCTCIIDSEGVEIRKMLQAKFLEFFKEVAFIANNYYPEILKQGFVVGAPRIFAFCYAIVKPFIPVKTIEKVSIFGSNRNDWTEKILNAIPEDQLAPKYGGVNPEMDPAWVYLIKNTEYCKLA
jgi:hypothetical protein